MLLKFIIKRLNLSLNNYLWLIILFIINKIMIRKWNAKVIINEISEKVKIRFLKFCENIYYDFINCIKIILN